MAEREKPWFFLLILLFNLFFFTPIFADDAAIMKKLAGALSPTPSGWSASDPCNWTGVNCDTSNRVTSINLASKSLSGSLPSDLNQLTQLKTLALQNNQLSGALPSLSNLSQLQSVFLDSNNFTSVPPSFLSGLTSLATLSLSQNSNLSPWPFPKELTGSSSLVTLYISKANLMGSIPDIFDLFQSLQSLRLSYNNLTGSLPSSLAKTSIQNLWLNNQGLSGPIDVIGRMSMVSQLWLHANAFTGPIPDLSQSISLFDLQLRDNQLTGVVPNSLISLTGLQNVSLSNNKLQGPYPDFNKGVQVLLGTTNSFCNTNPGPCDPQVTALLAVAGALGYPMNLADSWAGNDPCQGWTFVSCDSQKKNVVVINFSKQKFEGTISPAIANLTSLRNLILNDNNLTGPIPDALASMSQLLVLDVSNNNLTGKIPVFATRVSVTSTGNPFLGNDSSSGGNGNNTRPPSSRDSPSGSPSGKGKSNSISAGLIFGIVAAVILLLVVILFSCVCWTKKRHAQKSGRVQSPEHGMEMMKNGIGGTVNGYGGSSVNKLSSQSNGSSIDIPVSEGGNVTISIQVLRQVTNNFSEDNILGRGGFGIVYGGKLHDGTQIAVKRMESNAMGTKGLNEFQAEIAVLTKVRHRHLVALLGFCTNNNERLLVYEYMPQGTLGQHLFDWSDNGYPPLTWKQRVTIALDVARGVEYLHSLAQQSFIHRDLKPSNVLLGDDMRAKVSDFGLVKNAPDGKYSVETRLAGTFGYLAPEYAATGRVTTKVDVYAFGVILMELVTGRKTLDESLPDERSHLVTWFRRILINKDDIRKAIDATLDPDDETFGYICTVAELAGHCTAREPSQRPDMGHAVNILGPLVQQWKPTCREEDDNSGIDLNMPLSHALQIWQSDEGTSTMIGDDSSRRTSFENTQSSIPTKPLGFADPFNSINCR